VSVQAGSVMKIRHCAPAGVESPDERAITFAANSIARAGAIADYAEDAVDEHEFIHEALGFPSRLSLIRSSGTFSLCTPCGRQREKEKRPYPFQPKTRRSLMNVPKILYTATATARGGREGHIRSSDGVLDLALKLPKELGGPGGAGSNPEQLFAAGYAACFEGAIRFVAGQRKIAIKDAEVTGRVGIGPRDTTGFGIAVELDVSLPVIDPAVAQDLIDTAHRDICPYSHATRGNVDVKIALV